MNTIDLNLGMNGLRTWSTIYRDPVELGLSADARGAIARSHQSIEKIIEDGGAVYGINTGFGRLAGTAIPDRKLSALQSNVVLSHAIGSGPALSLPETRLVMSMKIASLAQGHSGVRPALVDLMITMFNQEILPLIPSQGSVGASGDLTPHAHVAAPLIGQGQVHAFGQIMTAKQAFDRAGLSPLSLQPKEGLALLNGTQVSTALALTGAFEAR